MPPASGRIIPVWFVGREGIAHGASTSVETGAWGRTSWIKEIVMWIVRYMRWIMLVSGVLTATMVQAAIAPDSALEANFGETVSGPVAHTVARNWGALIALIGGMLIYGAFNLPQRSLVLVVAGTSKVVFIVLVLCEGARYLSHQAGVAIAIDSVMVVLFGWYLVATRSVTAPPPAAPTRLSV
jgi:hypothetical protein